MRKNLDNLSPEQAQQFVDEKKGGVSSPFSDIKSKLLSDYLSGNVISDGYSKSNYLSKEGFLEWLNFNYPDLPDDYKNQLLTAFNSYSGTSFSPNLWQQLGELLGDFSGRSNFENLRFTNLNTSISEILNAYHGEQFSDPANELSRRKAAGLNDDISGGSSIGSGQAGDIALPDNLPSPQNTGESILPEIASTSMQVISMAMSLCQGFQSLSQGDLSLMLGSLDLFSKSNEAALEGLSNGLTEDNIRVILDPEAVNDKGERLYSEEVVDTAFAHLGQVMNVVTSDKRLPRSLRNKLRRSWRPGMTSIRQTSFLYDVLSKAYSNKGSAVRNGGDPFVQFGFEKCLDIMTNHIQKTSVKVKELQAKFESDRLSTVNENGESLGTAAGKAEHSTYNSESLSKEFQAAEDQMWKDIMDDLKSDDSMFSYFLRFAIPISRHLLSSFHFNASPSKNMSFGF